MKKKNNVSKAGIFGPDSNFSDRFITDYKQLGEFAAHCKGIGLKIVLTQGTYDMVHIGHARYFEEAKKHGDLLVVGVDSDKKVRARKGPDRPIVPQEERLEMVTHLRSVDVVALKEHNAPKFHLIKTVKPDVLIITEETLKKYDKEQLAVMKSYCGKVVTLKPMATTTTSAKIRLMQLKLAKKFEQALVPKLSDMVTAALANVKPKEINK